MIRECGIKKSFFDPVLKVNSAISTFYRLFLEYCFRIKGAPISFLKPKCRFCFTFVQLKLQKSIIVSARFGRNQFIYIDEHFFSKTLFDNLDSYFRSTVSGVFTREKCEVEIEDRMCILIRANAIAAWLTQNYTLLLLFSLSN